MKYMTIREIPSELARALEQERRRTDKSLNQLVKDLLGRALGVGANKNMENGLKRFAGTWTEQEFQEFEKAVCDIRQVDPELWK